MALRKPIPIPDGIVPKAPRVPPYKLPVYKARPPIPANDAPLRPPQGPRPFRTPWLPLIIIWELSDDPFNWWTPPNPASEYPKGGSFHRVYGPFYYSSPYQNSKALGRATADYHMPITGQAISGWAQTLEIPPSYYPNRFGLWRWNQNTTISRFAHHSSYDWVVWDSPLRDGDWHNSNDYKLHPRIARAKPYTSPRGFAPPVPEPEVPPPYRIWTDVPIEPSPSPKPKGPGDGGPPQDERKRIPGVVPFDPVPLEPKPQPQPLPEGDTSPPPPDYTRAPPSGKEKEGKALSKSKRVAIAAYRVMDRLSEGAEIVDAVYAALPADVRKRWEKGRPKSRGFVDQAGQYGIDGADWKAKAIYMNFHKLDIAQAWRNILQNELEDKAYGAAHASKDKLLKRGKWRNMNTDDWLASFK